MERVKWGSMDVGSSLIINLRVNLFHMQKKLGYDYIYATSNGQPPVNRFKAAIDAGLDLLKFSFNAIDATAYAKVHGTSLSAFYRIKDKINEIGRYITVNGYLTRLYISSVYIDDWDADLKKQLNMLFPHNISEIVLYRATNQAGQMNSLPEKEHGKLCYIPFSTMRLTSSGLINACCVDFSDTLSMGKYIKGKLGALWTGASYTLLRDKLLNGHLNGLICKACIYGSYQ